MVAYGHRAGCLSASPADRARSRRRISRLASATATEVSNLDPAPAFGFGHGLTYTTFDWSDLQVGNELSATDGQFELECTVRNTGTLPGTEVVQLYLHDPVPSVVQPVQRLIGYVRLPELAPDEAVRVRVRVSADLASFTGREGLRLVEPGEMELRLSASSTEPRLTARFALTGPVREVDHRRRLHAHFAFTVEP